ncbi:MAG TPA: anti-sigma B factor RsbW [Savagea sp.]
MAQHDYIEMVIPAKAQYVGVVRLAISGVASRIGFSYDDIEDLKIAISEAVTNAVRHAYHEEDEGQVKIGYRLYEDRLEIVVSDSGKSYQEDEIERRVAPYDESSELDFLQEGGLGLYLIEALMDDVQIDHKEGVTVRMTKHVNRERGEADATQTISN